MRLKIVESLCAINKCKIGKIVDILEPFDEKQSRYAL